MRRRFLATLTLVSVLTSVKAACNYKIKDGIYEHTFCKYSGRSQDCTDYVPISISPTNRKTIVDTHNKIRHMIANGQEDGYQGAQNMYELKWDNELARIAQRWADQCSMSHDDNHDVEYKGETVSVGQNIGQHNVKATGMDYAFGVQRWYSKELPIFSPGVVKAYEYNVKYGHLSQVIWGKTKKVGCGISQYTDNLGKVYLFVCNYAPSGNFEEEPVYVIANNNNEIGKMCPKRSISYRGLCAPSDNIGTTTSSSSSSSGSGVRGSSETSYATNSYNQETNKGDGIPTQTANRKIPQYQTENDDMYTDPKQAYQQTEYYADPVSGDNYYYESGDKEPQQYPTENYNSFYTEPKRKYQQTGYYGSGDEYDYQNGYVDDNIPKEKSYGEYNYKPNKMPAYDVNYNTEDSSSTDISYDARNQWDNFFNT